MKLAVVLDTNHVVSAILWGGQSGRLILLAQNKQVELISSIPPLEGLSAVLSRRKFQERIAATAHSAAELVAAYAQDVRLVRPVEIGRIAPDPDDDVVIATAIAAKADLLVTGDKSLLSVGKYTGGRIVTASDALRLVDEFEP